MRALAISSAERLPGLDVPTLREQGVDVEFENWRSVVAPPGIGRASVNASSRSSRPWSRRPSGERRSNDTDGSIAISPVMPSLASSIARRRECGRRCSSWRPDRTRGGALASVGVYPTFVLTGLALCAVAALVVGRSASRAVSSHRVSAEDLRHSLVDWAGARRSTSLMAETAWFRHRVHGDVLADGQGIRRSAPGSGWAVCGGNVGCRVRAVRTPAPELPLPAGAATWSARRRNA